MAGVFLSYIESNVRQLSSNINIHLQNDLWSSNVVFKMINWSNKLDKNKKQDMDAENYTLNSTTKPPWEFYQKQ